MRDERDASANVPFDGKATNAIVGPLDAGNILLTEVEKFTLRIGDHFGPLLASQRVGKSDPAYVIASQGWGFAKRSKG